MPLTREFKDTVQARLRSDRKYRRELLRQGVECRLTGDLDAGKANRGRSDPRRRATSCACSRDGSRLHASSVGPCARPTHDLDRRILAGLQRRAHLRPVFERYACDLKHEAELCGSNSQGDDHGA